MSSFSSSSFFFFFSYSSSGTTAPRGLCPVEKVPLFCPICNQLSLSSHSEHLKFSFYFFCPSFPGPSPSFRLPQFLIEGLFGHPILLRSLQVAQPTYPLPLYPFYQIFSFNDLSQFSIRPTFPFPTFLFRTIYSSKYFPFKNQRSLFFLLHHPPCFRSIRYYRSYQCLIQQNFGSSG